LSRFMKLSSRLKYVFDISYCLTIFEGEAKHVPFTWSVNYCGKYNAASWCKQHIVTSYLAFTNLCCKQTNLQNSVVFSIQQKCNLMKNVCSVCFLWIFVTSQTMWTLVEEIQNGRMHILVPEFQLMPFRPKISKFQGMVRFFIT
jgi:hypothetical protein